MGDVEYSKNQEGGTEMTKIWETLFSFSDIPKARA